MTQGMNMLAAALFGRYCALAVELEDRVAQVRALTLLEEAEARAFLTSLAGLTSASTTETPQTAWEYARWALSTGASPLSVLASYADRMHRR